MSDRALDSWCFEFNLVPAEEGGFVPYGAAEELMVGVILPWTRARDYEVGGGFHKAGEWWRRREGEWGYAFSVAATHEDRLVPEAQVAALVSVIEAFAADHGARVEGGYREFRDEDWPPPPDEGLEGETRPDEGPCGP